jgi:hypothetical protein
VSTSAAAAPIDSAKAAQESKSLAQTEKKQKPEAAVGSAAALTGPIQDRQNSNYEMQIYQPEFLHTSWLQPCMYVFVMIILFLQ